MRSVFFLDLLQHFKVKKTSYVSKLVYIYICVYITYICLQTQGPYRGLRHSWYIQPFGCQTYLLSLCFPAIPLYQLKCTCPNCILAWRSSLGLPINRKKIDSEIWPRVSGLSYEYLLNCFNFWVNICVCFCAINCFTMKSSRFHLCEIFVKLALSTYFYLAIWNISFSLSLEI